MATFYYKVYRCDICGRKAYGYGSPSKDAAATLERRCGICQKAICRRCYHHGLCTYHYNLLSPEALHRVYLSNIKAWLSWIPFVGTWILCLWGGLWLTTNVLTNLNNGESWLYGIIFLSPLVFLVLWMFYEKHVIRSSQEFVKYEALNNPTFKPNTLPTFKPQKKGVSQSIQATTTKPITRVPTFTAEAETTIPCPLCGIPNSRTLKFCSVCGAELNRDSNP